MASLGWFAAVVFNRQPTGAIWHSGASRGPVQVPALAEVVAVVVVVFAAQHVDARGHSK